MNDYPRFHQDRGNLMLHMVGVPAFVAGTVSAVYGIFTAQGALITVAMVVAAVGFGMQALGHRREAVPSVPFRGPWDFVVRILTEQFVRFPRYVITGGFNEAWQNTRQ